MHPLARNSVIGFVALLIAIAGGLMIVLAAFALAAIVILVLVFYVG